MTITKSDLGWIIAVWLGAGLAWSGIAGWFTGQYQVTRTGRFRWRVVRRWYSTSAHVCFRADAGLDDPAWFRVIWWTDEGTQEPLVLIAAPDDDEFPPCPCFVTDLAPLRVRRLRPHLARYGRLLVPQLHEWLPPRRPAGWLEVDA